MKYEIQVKVEPKRKTLRLLLYVLSITLIPLLLILQFGFHDYIFIYIKRQETPIIIREFNHAPLRKAKSPITTHLSETTTLRTEHSTAPNLPIWQSIIIGSDEGFRKVHRQFKDIVDLGQEEIDLRVTTIDQSNSIEKNLMTSAEVIIIASEHDYVPYDTLIKSRNRFINMSTVGCMSPLAYPIPKSVQKSGRKHVTKAQTSPGFTKTEGGYLYQKFKPSFIADKILFNRTLCENEPIILNPAVVRLLQNSTQIEKIKTTRIPVQYKKVANVMDYLMMEKHLSPSYRQIHAPLYFDEAKEKTILTLLQTPKTRACVNGSIVLLVKSSRQNSNLRKLIRKLVQAQRETMKKMALDLYFVLGKSDSRSSEISINQEIEAFDDIVVGDFIDSYRNLTMKTLAAHTFLNSSHFTACSTDWVIFHDDDSFVNYSKFEQSIGKHQNSTGLFCMWNNIKPQIPMRYSKYGLTMDEYPFGYWFPGFCNGPCAGMTRQTSQKILKVAQSVGLRKFPLEDVLFTGIFRQKANISELNRLPYTCEHYSTHKEAHLLTRLSKLKSTRLSNKIK